VRLQKPYGRILNISHTNPSRSITFYGRTCYKSIGKVDSETKKKFIQGRIKAGHLSVIEHESVTVEVVCDRGVSHELVRHRLAAFSQESTRYCNYKDHVTFIIPPWTDIKEGTYGVDWMRTTDEIANVWMAAMINAEIKYSSLLSLGWSPQQARSVLPNSLKTELIMTANLREWRHIFSLRCDKSAHPQMREIMIPLLKDFFLALPDFFEDLYEQFIGGNCEREELS